MPKYRLPLLLSCAGALVVTAMTGLATPAAASCSDGPREGVDWSDCRKRNLILRGTTLTDANLADTDLTSTDLRDANLDGANMVKDNLLKAHLDGSTLIGTDLEKVVGYRSRFHDTDLTDSDFEKAEMQRADFTGATIHNVNFDRSELGRVTFTGASLNNVNFDFAILARADFRDARLDGPINLTSAYLFLTRFEGQDLSDATGLVQAQLDLSCGNSETVLPEGLTQPSSWPCSEEAVE
ncbi:MAG: pentapeptide repeat-containing protein [Pseudomonadota bacterium]